MRVLLGLGDVALGCALLGQPLGENVVHALGREGNVERVVNLVLRHRRDVQILGQGEIAVGKVGAINAEEEGDLANTVGAVVEEEAGIVVYMVRLAWRTS